MIFPLPKAAGNPCNSRTSMLFIRTGLGLKRVTAGGSFCGGPKWMSDSRPLVAY